MFGFLFGLVLMLIYVEYINLNKGIPGYVGNNPEKGVVIV